ncbi:MAG: hypothetical protein AAF184_20445 [Pseudomonadota bacterium]
MPSSPQESAYAARVGKLMDALQPFSPGLTKRFGIDPHSNLLRGTIHPPNFEDREKIEEVLAAFPDLIARCDIYERMPDEVIHQHIGQCDLPRMQQLLAEDLLRVAALARQEQGDDPAYAMVVWMDPPQGGLGYRLLCSRGFARDLAQCQASEYGHFYQSSAQIQGHRFYEFESFSYDPCAELLNTLMENNDRATALFHRYGNAFSSETSEYMELMTDVCVEAIQGAVDQVKQTLLIEEGFVMLVDYYDQALTQSFRAARRTMSAAQLSTLLGDYYRNFLP